MATTQADRPHEDEPEISTWLSEGGADRNATGAVSKEEILATLDFLAAHVPGYPIASRVAATLAAGIRVRGLRRG